MDMALHLARPCASPSLRSESLTCRSSQGRQPAKLQFRSLRPRCDSSNASEAESADSLKASAVSRRQALVKGLVAGLAVPSFFGLQSASAEPSEAVDEKTRELQTDEINAYTYTYPVSIGQGKTLSWVESRKPERYSSAAPLAPDARQRIVSERIDLKNNLVISVSVGPPNSAFLKTNDINTWAPKAVAQSVLADKSTARMTMGQRVAEVSIVDAHKEEVDGVPYFYYEYLVQKSPTMMQGGVDVFRHSVAVTTEREGYLYSLNASTLDSRWDMMGPAFNETAKSFRITPPTEEYVPPYKDPWRFW
ncbi:hypothetical protein KC19_VG104500 [Ceratodon purpureus]|uniref:PsbP C-terminal domain-containing protein n=1 Tax=Ceratodon purpureus TaxID=3225 RepID=A0A8T0HPL9_CERPU|nr:hypothetical protein KC19_VG104500 [Ceratodon purpureus]